MISTIEGGVGENAIPETRYATTSDGLTIAYQVFGRVLSTLD